jgi:hypothetical protein
VRHAGRNRNEATGGKRPLVTVEVDQRLPVEDVEGFLLGGVGVKRRHLALTGDLLQKQIRPRVTSAAETALPHRAMVSRRWRPAQKAKTRSGQPGARQVETTGWLYRAAPVVLRLSH